MVLVLLLSGCIKPAPPATTGGGRTLTVIGVMDVADARPAEDTPVRFDTAILGAVGARNLVPNLVESADRLAPLTPNRDTAPRLRALADEAGNGPLLLVETRPVYYSELNGQYRWTVGVDVTLAGAPSPFSAHFDVPVFLRYHHEREEEAVDAASPVVARKVGEVLDAWLGSGG
jgi:hypothetical protein